MVEYVGSQQDFMKIPMLGIVPESSSTAPSSPTTGQLWNDSANNVLKRYNGSTWEVVGSTPGSASESAQGIIEIATQTETNTGTDDTRAVTPLKLKTYVDATLATVDVMVFKGVIDCSTNPNYPAADRGHTYRVSVAGKIGGASGVNVEVGDLLICLTDGTSAGTQAAVGANWTITQTNIDGAVTGPTSSTSGNLVSFSGTGGKVVQDTGVAVSTDGTFAANSDAKVPTEKAVKTYAQPKDSFLTSISGNTSLPVALGGTGSTSASGGRTNLNAAGRYSATLGALSAGTPLTITHNLGNTDVVATFRLASDDSLIRLAWKPASGNAISVTSDVAFSASAIKVAVIG